VYDVVAGRAQVTGVGLAVERGGVRAVLGAHFTHAGHDDGEILGIRAVRGYWLVGKRERYIYVIYECEIYMEVKCICIYKARNTSGGRSVTVSIYKWERSFPLGGIRGSVQL